LEYDFCQVGPLGIALEYFWMLIIFRAANMLATLKMIRANFGSVIEKCGLTKEEVEKIRKNLIVEEPAVHMKLQQNL
jgi:hypothetical protein